MEILAGPRRKHSTDGQASISKQRQLKMKPSEMKRKIDMKLVTVIFTLLMAWVATSTAATTNQSAEPNKCSTAGLQEVSPKDMKSKLRHTQSIDPPCCDRNLNLKGTLVFLVVIGERGDVTCVELVSGDPMIVNSAIHSVTKWRFQPDAVKGQPRAFYGRLAIKFHATERDVSFKVTDQLPKEPPTHTTQ